jgi:hypothetical protein
MSKRECSICAHASSAAIDDLLVAGANQKDVAVQFSVSRFAVSRHVRHSVPAPEGSLNTSRDEIGKWLRRADDQYLLATVDSDQRGAISALVGGLRAIEAQIRNDEREVEAKPVAGDGGRITLGQLDSILSAVPETPETQLIREITWAIERVITFSGRSESLNLVGQLLETANPELLPRFSEYKTRRIAEGDRCDLPVRGSHEAFSQYAN